jgi:2-dehydro-3-deoxygluconokinase
MPWKIKMRNSRRANEGTAMKPVAFASIGECMIELSAGKADLWRMGFAGDTFNTAWYARAILPKAKRVAYVTALGDDPFSDRMREFIGAAGVRTDRIRAVAGRRPGLYAITLKNAERAFTYWRGQSAAKLLADDAAWLSQALDSAEMVYFSGITLAILSPTARRRLLRALAAQRKAGARVAFDPNYRPALWPDQNEARAAMEAAYRVADIALPTFSDEKSLFGDKRVDDTARRMAAAGVPEFVVKNGDKDVLVFADGEHASVPASRPKRLVDTTGAGDSFSGAYLAARHLGIDPPAAAKLGNVVAAEVIGVHGALAKIDRDRVLKLAKTSGRTSSQRP